MVIRWPAFILFGCAIFDICVRAIFGFEQEIYVWVVSSLHSASMFSTLIYIMSNESIHEFMNIKESK